MAITQANARDLAVNLDMNFPRYTDYNPKVPVWFVTPNIEGVFHRFYDTSPISSSGRYVVGTRLRDESRYIAAGDAADIVVIDLSTGESRIVATTYGYDTQLGAHAQWGASDDDLLYNDIDLENKNWEVDWQPHAVHLNLDTGESRRLGGPVYMASPDGSQILSPCTKRLRRGHSTTFYAMECGCSKG